MTYLFSVFGSLFFDGSFGRVLDPERFPEMLGQDANDGGVGDHNEEDDVVRAKVEVLAEEINKKVVRTAEEADDRDSPVIILGLWMAEGDGFYESDEIDLSMIVYLLA